MESYNMLPMNVCGIYDNSSKSYIPYSVEDV